MIEEKTDLVDIASELLIVPERTIEKLFTLNNSCNCVALYMFYYKTAKWQKTNKIKALDVYVMKCLHWGKTKLVETKQELIKCGLIRNIQVRNEKGEITGWYVGINYNFSNVDVSNVKVMIEPTGTVSERWEKTTSCSQDTNAYIYNNINAYSNTNKKEEIYKENITYDEIIEYLNNKTGKHFKSNISKTKSLIKARFNEGFTLEDFKNVIDKKTDMWVRDENMSMYLRPETLFGNKFESYLNEEVKNKYLMGMEVFGE